MDESFTPTLKILKKILLLKSLNLPTCVDVGSTYTKKYIYIYKTKNSQWSPVDYHVSPVACHLSLMPTVTDPPRVNSPTMHSRLVREDQKKSNAKNHLKQII